MIKNMTEAYAKEIITWRYAKPYDVYCMKDAYDELMKRYQVVYKDELIGFFCTGRDAQVPPYGYNEDFLDFGIGLKPELCGNGYGELFMREIIEYIDIPLRLTVLAWNERARKLYLKLGFKDVDQFYRGERLFVIMTQ